jgi:hypothetical protein
MEAGAGLRQPAQAEPAADLREPQGLPARPVRPPHRAGRSGADDGRPGLHDGPRATRCAPAPASTTSWAACLAPWGAMAALAQRAKRPARHRQGQEVQSALFENNVFLVAQHMMQFAVTGQPAAPMPSAHFGLGHLRRVHRGRTASRFSWPWSATRSGRCFCDAFGFADLADPRLASNNDRVRARDWMMPLLRERLAGHAAAELRARFEAHRPAVCAHHPARRTCLTTRTCGHRRPGARDPARRARNPCAAAAADAGRPAPRGALNPPRSVSTPGLAGRAWLLPAESN